MTIKGQLQAGQMGSLERTNLSNTTIKGIVVEKDNGLVQIVRLETANDKRKVLNAVTISIHDTDGKQISGYMKADRRNGEAYIDGRVLTPTKLVEYCVNK